MGFVLRSPLIHTSHLQLPSVLVLWQRITNRVICETVLVTRGRAGVQPPHWREEMAGTQGIHEARCGNSHRASDSSSKTLRFPLRSHRARTMGRVPISPLQTGLRAPLFFSNPRPTTSRSPPGPLAFSLYPPSISLIYL